MKKILKYVCILCFASLLYLSTIPNAFADVISFSGSGYMSKNGEKVIIAGKSITLSYDYSNYKYIRKISGAINGETVFSESPLSKTIGSITFEIDENQSGNLSIRVEYTNKNLTRLGATYNITVIPPQKISDTEVIIEGNISYTGKSLTPPVTVKHDGKELEKGHDYTLTFANNINAGTARVTVTGINEYSGSKQVSFNISKAKMSSVSIAAIKNQTYTGKAIKPTLSVKLGTVKLTNGIDYTVKYTSNTKIGKATITLTGKENLTGSKKVTFKIIPKGTTISKLTAATKKITAKWRKQAVQTTGYQIQFSTTKTFKTYKTLTISKVSILSKTLNNLSANKTYYIRIRTFKTVSGTKYYSNWSAYKSVKVK